MQSKWAEGWDRNCKGNGRREASVTDTAGGREGWECGEEANDLLLEVTVTTRFY